ncbi:ArgR family transcriptional regulator [Acidipropionibacterium jensenii]|uniref:arginine repressor n=1 Tax=Acidipropionibacterium jensenii TaxID=1749 RepID=UPI000BC35CE1|nr:ArgR family transcriptional regulator [Acidipropionibacterium jensenii]AZZ41633.1 ArgR family transcriptional regulator [Acidipropionibacterium jensenii]
MSEGTNGAPASRAARQARIRDLVAAGHVSSQSELGQRLAEEGMAVSQGTLSRDLVEIGAVRGRDLEGNPCYTIPSGEHPSDVTTGSPAWTRLARLTRELCTGVQHNDSLVVLKTPPGAAQYFGSAIDKAGLAVILGTIAGDDTIALICARGIGADELADAFREMAETGAPAALLAHG